MTPVERDIVTKILDDATAAGYTFGITDEDSQQIDHFDYAGCLAMLEDLDEAYVSFFEGNSVRRVGWVHLIFVNDGYDAITDYSDNKAMRALLANAEALAADYAQKAGA